ncbi:hypothetical protein JUNP543_1190 [Acinetobacter baumannii]|uniref:DUF2460 domain-containing protein n=1 Tax=Acinetobacter baumannii TaxID=470 RepID=UPI001409989E|nr:DUF2460 domain-containing protein [Acinetobacter baumannii]MEC6440978.1 DUF2460 domain-containing protein [Acinetobacter baumannii]MEC6639362.1 DUF2460 domain-containing protein [Acinetobacter baumannii]MEC6738135.1 DUF2460 domain-containing protein [Acinetobacter baumannii]NHQ49430.1 DUF2460 domain-containing protein [Acinetobacter baumannii]HAV6044771.1 hypothetical protein [Acinetobacter baumannii]
MSNVLFPELPGLEWDLSKAPMFNTKIMTSINGRELRASYQSSPKYEISMSYSFLRESKGRSELQQLEGFFIDRRGAFDSFLYKMPDDNQFSCTIVGNGSSEYQVFKEVGQSKLYLGNTEPDFSEDVDPPMWNEEPASEMWTNDQENMWFTGFGLLSNGIVKFSQDLAEGQSIQVSGTFYYRCRFKDDEQEYVNFMHKLWKAQKVELIGSLGNKI